MFKRKKKVDIDRMWRELNTAIDRNHKAVQELMIEIIRTRKQVQSAKELKGLPAAIIDQK